VWIEAGLPSRSRENGNISACGRRLSAFSPLTLRDRELGDGSQNRKSPPLAGISGYTKGKISRRRTGWLTWEDSNFHTPISKNAFEMSAEFPLLRPKIRPGDFCSYELWK
jgi:hypothetical protein